MARLYVTLIGGILLAGAAHGLFFGTIGSSPFFQFNASFNVQLSANNQANRTITNLLNSTLNIAGNAARRAENFLAGLESIADGVRDQLSDEIAEGIESVIEHCTMLLENASNSSSEVRECIEEQISNANLLANSTSANVENCIAEKLQQGVNITARLIGLKLNATRLAANMTARYVQCLQLGSSSILSVISPRVLACKLGLIAQYSGPIAKIARQEIATAAQAAAYLATLKADLLLCGTEFIAEAVEEAAAIAAASVQCSANE